MVQQLSPGQVIEEPQAQPLDQEWRDNLSVHLICPDCREDPPNLTEEMSQGDVVCMSCGLTVGDRLVDTRSEWRTFANDESGGDDPSRVGKANNPLDAGPELETSISFGDGGMRSREISRAHAKLSQDKSRKAMTEGYSRIQQICNQLNMGESTTDYAKHLYKLAHAQRMFKGKNTDTICAGCVFIANRKSNNGLTFKEMNKVTRVSKKEIGKTFKLLQEFMQKHVDSSIDGPEQTTSADELCGRYGSRLVMSQAAINSSKDIAKNIDVIGALAGRSPLSIAAACLYMGSHLMGDPKSPKDIANTAGVSDGTIRTAYKYMYPERKQLINEKWLTKAMGGDMSKLPAV